MCLILSQGALGDREKCCSASNFLFTARRYDSAVYAVVVFLSVRTRSA